LIAAEKNAGIGKLQKSAGRSDRGQLKYFEERQNPRVRGRSHGRQPLHLNRLAILIRNRRNIVAEVIQYSTLGKYGYFDEGMTGDYRVDVSSDEIVSYTFEGGTEVVFIGENLGFDESENPVGTISRVLFVSGDDEVLGTVEGLNLSATVLYEATVQSGYFAGFMGTLLSGDDTETGSVSNDLMYGFGGNDTLNGGRERDLLFGGFGDDLLIGGTDKDVLVADAGKDRLRGGTGADAFHFLDRLADASPSAVFQQRDTVLDFSLKDKDHLDLSGMDANDNEADEQSFSFIGKRDFSGTAGELRFEMKKNDTFVYGDTDGDGDANFAIELNGRLKLTIDVFNL
jgi:Ca2+-binding RTX toxin-like protein